MKFSLHVLNSRTKKYVFVVHHYQHGDVSWVDLQLFSLVLLATRRRLSWKYQLCVWASYLWLRNYITVNYRIEWTPAKLNVRKGGKKEESNFFSRFHSSQTPLHYAMLLCHFFFAKLKVSVFSYYCTKKAKRKVKFIKSFFFSKSKVRYIERKQEERERDRMRKRKLISIKKIASKYYLLPKISFDK